MVVKSKPIRSLNRPADATPFLENEKKIALKIQNLEVDFGVSKALIDTSMDIYQGELICLLGPSGCGKTTTLNAIAGLIMPTAGSIYLHGKDVTLLEPRRRKLGLVFQNYALYPHMSVYRNIAFPLRNDPSFAAAVKYHNADIYEKINVIKARAGTTPKETIDQLLAQMDESKKIIIRLKEDLASKANLLANTRVRIKTASVHAASEKISRVRQFSLDALNDLGYNDKSDLAKQLLDGKKVDPRGRAIAKAKMISKGSFQGGTRLMSKMILPKDFLDFDYTKEKYLKDKQELKEKILTGRKELHGSVPGISSLARGIFKAKPAEKTLEAKTGGNAAAPMHSEPQEAKNESQTRRFSFMGYTLFEQSVPLDRIELTNRKRDLAIDVANAAVANKIKLRFASE